ncbi:HAMP domain-containing protein [Lysobacter sp. KIS68-7]|uniref:sensor histidine kinase n=1 Tax=Lysobacter sp. KIS68-7 TaxID=2904252 RepID=UPI001E5C0BAF|nr:histidine kinase dimerization/phospho-acceptor domain-containing protein [Lysobacter sp. KIS68-7]UHQ19556.1 HAMP domain-containing protein [Lysobacter sp. KIS68-7]
MTSPVSLRKRVAWASAALGLVMCVLFGLGVVAVAEDYEHILAKEILRGQAEDYGLRIANGLPAHLPRTQRLSGYLLRPPPQYAGFAPGVHEDPDHEGIHVGVFDTRAGRLYFVIDLGDIEATEQHLNIFLILMTLLGVAVGGWLGWLFAGRALAPVGALADEVDRLPQTPVKTDLEGRVSSDELGRLARAIDDYQARLVDADARQLAFFADASHALRTPIAVVQGVAEVMLDEPTTDAASTSRLQRLERGVEELADLLELLLALARRTPVEHEVVELDGLVREAFARWLQDPQAGPVLDVSGTAYVARRESVLLLRMLARKQFAASKGLRVQGSAGRLELSEPGLAPPPATTAQRADSGAIPALMSRAAERAGWRLRWVPGRVSMEVE